jgi:amidase
MTKRFSYLLLAGLLACSEPPKVDIAEWVPYDESSIITKNADHPSRRMQYKLIQSRNTDRNDMWSVIKPQLVGFDSSEYESLKPLILEKDIMTLQAAVDAGELTYKKLVQWYLYRIATYENDSTLHLNNIISINPNAVTEAEKRDASRAEGNHPIFGMPVLLKDNVNFEGIPTTAGAVALQNNYTKDAFITSQIESKGGIILGKSSLSEWANFLCTVCPNGYNAIGGQTLNPYGRGEFDTGGSSSGSGSAIAANYAVAAVGTETSGSILSPSSSNSIVGLKPTVGLLSRGGIVPISSTLDTPGPMTRSVLDNAILLSAMTGKDEQDPATDKAPEARDDYWESIQSGSVSGLRLGALQPFMQDSMYRLHLEKLEEMGAEIIEVKPPQVNLSGFLTLLNIDMKNDLPDYMERFGDSTVDIRSVEDVIAFNLQDSANRMPYGQGRFEGIVNDTISGAAFDSLKTRLMAEGRRYFETMITENNLDAIVSVNNWSAGFAAVAHHPCLTVPMGYEEDGTPKGITFVAGPFEEEKLLKIGYAYEQANSMRKIPENYQ